MPKTAPRGLGPTGRRLWRDVAGPYTLRPDENRILEDACREVDLIDKLQSELDDGGRGLIVKGSMGQPTANPMVSELRQHRATLQRLLASLKLPDEPGGEKGEEGERSAKARSSAGARWGARGA